MMGGTCALFLVLLYHVIHGGFRSHLGFRDSGIRNEDIPLRPYTVQSAQRKKSRHTLFRDRFLTEGRLEFGPLETWYPTPGPANRP